ncbi:MAG: beta-lactamase family protein [Gemmatimonadota bacterium]|nr:beta-lactamase family protein [Gemmatimonadota bacterium]
MMRILLCCVLFLAACATSAPAPAPLADAVAERIQRVENGLLTSNVIAGEPLAGMPLAERMRFYDTPGVSIAVINDGRIEWARGYGVAEAGGAQPVDTATLFQAASISKPVAAMAALRLVEQGRLSLDEDVNGRLVSWKVPENGHTREQKVTLRRLLSHSAGLTVHGFRGYAAGEPVPTLLQLLDGASPANSAAVRADVVPGSLWRYSGGGTSVAQQLMTEVTGSPFPELMRELVLGPVGMVHSTYEQPLPVARAAKAATGHRGDGMPVAGKWHTYPEMAAAGLWTTPSDLARLALEVQRPLRGENGGVLSPRMTREMLTLQSGEYGLGFGLAGEGRAARFSHGGANEGFRAHFVAFRETGQGAVVMTNSDNGAALASEILRAVAREYGWDAFQSREKALARVDTRIYPELAGRYRIEQGGETRWLTVSASDDGLHAQVPGWAAPLAMHPASEERYFFLETGVELTFVRDSAGAVDHVLITGAGPPIRAQRER